MRPYPDNIRLAVHAMFTDVTEHALQLMLQFPKHKQEASVIVSEGHASLRLFMNRLDGTDWKHTPSSELTALCRDAESITLKLLSRIQALKALALSSEPIT